MPEQPAASTCEWGCCEWTEDGEVVRYAPHPPSCRYCEDDAAGFDALGRVACERHIEETADDLRVQGIIE